MSRKPRILNEGEELPENDAHLIDYIPTEFREDFEKDIINALREIAGVSTLARHPFFIDTESVSRAFGKTQNILTRDSCDFVVDQLSILPKLFYKPELPRFAHIDLAISGDSAGVAIGTVTGFSKISDLGFESSEQSMMPNIHNCWYS